MYTLYIIYFYQKSKILSALPTAFQWLLGSDLQISGPLALIDFHVNCCKIGSNVGKNQFFSGDKNHVSIKRSSF